MGLYKAKSLAEKESTGLHLAVSTGHTGIETSSVRVRQSLNSLRFT